MNLFEIFYMLFIQNHVFGIGDSVITIFPHRTLPLHLKYVYICVYIQRRIQNPAKHLNGAFCRKLQQNRLLNTPLMLKMYLFAPNIVMIIHSANI